MLCYLAVLHAKHVEPERLMVLAVAASPRLPHVDDDHVVLTDHIQQFALVIGREFLCEAERNVSINPFTPLGT